MAGFPGWFLRAFDRMRPALCGAYLLLSVILMRFPEVGSVPTLTGFEYNAGYGYFQFTFNEEVLASTLDVSKIFFSGNESAFLVPFNQTAHEIRVAALNGAWDSFSSDDDIYQLTGTHNDLVSQGNTTSPYIYASSNDYARLIFFNYSFGMDASKVYVEIEEGAFTTFDGIECANVTTVPHMAETYNPDTLPPFVETFNYNANTGVMTLVFSEPVHRHLEGNDTSNVILMGGIAIQGASSIQSNLISDSNYVKLVDYSDEDEVKVVYTSQYGREVAVYIGYNNMNLIKVGSYIARSSDTTWFSLYSTNVANDTSGNSLALANMDQFSALEVTAFTADTTAPTLLWWAYDVFLSKVTLRFSEVVDAMTFNYSAIYFVSNSTVTSDSVRIRVDQAGDLDNPQTSDSNDIIINFSETKYGELLDIPALLTNENNSYLVLENGAPWDTSLAQNVFSDATTQADNARRVGFFYPDFYQPSVTSAVLDMTAKTLLLGFDKFVAGASLNTSVLWMQSVEAAGTGTSVHYFDTASIALADATKEDTKFVELALSNSAFNYLKLFSAMSRRMDSTYIGFLTTFIHDKAPAQNQVVAQPSSEAFGLTGYMTDTVAPTLTTWYADLDLGRLVLTFDEPLDLDSLDLTSLTLYSDNDATASATQTHQVANATLYGSAPSASTAASQLTVIVVQLDDAELNVIKNLAPLCQSAVQCLLSFPSTFGVDISTYNHSTGVYTNNSVEAVSMVQSSSEYHQADITGPKVSSFSLDMSQGQLTLHTNEPVYSGYFDASGISLYNNSDTLSYSHTLSSSSFVETYVDSQTLVVTFSRADYLALKGLGVGSNGTDTAHLTMSGSVLEDLAGNALNGTTDNNLGEPLMALSVTEDTLAPNLQAIYLAGSRYLHLYFSDIIDISTFDLTYMYLYSPAENDAQSLILATVNITEDSGDVVVYIPDALDTELVSDGIAQSQAQTLFYTTSDEIFYDVPRGNAGDKIALSDAIGEGLQLLYWRMDLSNRIIRIACSHNCSANGTIAAFDMTQFSIYSSSAQTEVSFTISDLFSTENDDTIRLDLDVTTFADITSKMSLVDKSTLSLKVEQNAITDSNALYLGDTSYTLTCRQVMIDTNAPSIELYTLDLNEGKLDIYFDKPISIASVQLGSLTLYAAQDAASNNVSLASATLVTTADGVTSIEISLSEGDFPTLLDKIHLSGDIGAAVASTYLQVAKGFLTDTNEPPNYIPSVALVNATQPDFITQDDSLPILESWTIDMDAMVMTVTYSEAVDFSANLASYYLLLEDTSDTTCPQRYLTSSTTRSGSGRTITIDIDNIDMNAIKLQHPRLCTTQFNCLLSIRSGAITDISHNANVYGGQLFAYATEPESHSPDVTPPTIQQFNFSADTGELYIELSEIVNCLTADLGLLRFQYAAFLGTSAQYSQTLYTSPDCNYATGAKSKSLFFYLDVDDLTSIKAKSSLFKSIETTFIGGGAGAFEDVFNNTFVDIASGQAVQAVEYHADVARPNLISYTVTSAKLLVLYFDEPVNTGAFDVSMIQVSDRPYPYHNLAYNLSSSSGFSSLYAADTNKMTLQVTLGGDYTYISTESTIFSQQSSTFMSIQAGLVSDTAGNPVLPLSPEDAVGLGPNLISWQVNLNTGVLTIKFSEEVYPNFTAIGLEFQRNVTRATDDPYVTLETPTVVTSVGDGTTFEVTLFPDDLNALKYNNIGSTLKHSYLVAPFNFTFSTVTSTLVPNLATSAVFKYRALKASVVSRDTTPPLITSFGLDLNQGLITVRFDEPVSLASLDFTGFSLLSSTEGSTVAFTEAINATLFNLTNLIVSFSSTEFNNVKIADAEGDLDGLIVAAGAINDVSGNAYPGNDEADFIPELNSTADLTPPVLIDAELDLREGELFLTFDEVVNVEQFLPTYITILSAADPSDAGTASVQLTNASLVSIDDQGLVTIDLSTYQVDKTSIDLESTLGTLTTNTFIMYDDVPDVYGNRVQTPTVLQASSVTPDDVDIRVVAFDFVDDYAANSRYEVDVYYNKVALVSSFVCSEYKVLLENTTDASAITLADGDCTVTTTDTYLNTIAFQVTGDTANSINALITGGSTGAVIEFMEIEGNGGTGVSDAYGNYLDAIAFRLKIGPHVRRWFFDLNDGGFTLIFSAPVNASSEFNSSCLGIYSPTTAEAHWLTSTSTTAQQAVGSGSPQSATNVYYEVDTTDLNTIKALDVKEGMYLMVRAGMLLGSKGNVDVVDIPYTQQFEPYILADDDVRPVLVNTSFDIGNALLTLTFDEPVRPTSVVQSNIKVASERRVRKKKNSNPINIKLGTPGATAERNGNDIKLTLSAGDQATLMLTAGIATSRSNTYIWYFSNTFYDYSGNAANTRSPVNAAKVGEFIPDTVRPVLQSFTVDIDTRRLTLSFSEPVVAASFNMTAVIVSSRNSRLVGTYYRLTGGTLLSNDAATIIIQITANDMSAIKGTDGLARDKSSFYLIIDSTFCEDTFDNAFFPIADGAGLVASTFAGDTEPPEVERVELDVENKRLTLEMSEMVILSSVDFTALTVQDDTTSPSNSHTLGASSTIYNPTGLLYDDEVVIDFSAADINQIKDLYPLVSTQNTSCISITSAFVTDVYDNAVTTIATTAAHRADEFNEDVSPPVVTHYAIDMSTRQVTLTWDESIKFSSVNMSQALLQQFDRAAFGESVDLSLTSASSSSGIYSVYIYIVIDSETAAYLKYKHIANMQNTSFFAFSANFASDNMGIYALARWDASIYQFEPFLPDSYTADTQAPVLTRWQIDRTNMTVILHFDEPVTLSNSTSIILSNSSNIATLGSVYTRLGTITESTSEANYARAQYFHLHSDSCAGVNATVGECVPADLHAIFASDTFYLLMEASAFYDYAYTPNHMAALADAKVESSPDCSVCPVGFYISTACTEVSDRVCTACSSCTTGYYQVEACSTYADTNCKECSSCAYGKYISTACGDTNDNTCSDCTKCGVMEFESVKCQLGLNTECMTCENCQLDAAEEEICLKKGHYQSWYDANCCFDADGVQVACNALDLANMKIAARNGRHHWVFPDDSVDMDVYGMGNTF